MTPEFIGGPTSAHFVRFAVRFVNKASASLWTKRQRRLTLAPPCASHTSLSHFPLQLKLRKMGKENLTSISRSSITSENHKKKYLSRGAMSFS